MLKHSEIHHQKKEHSSIRTVLLLYFNLDKKYPMIISTPCSQYCENAQFLNRSTGMIWGVTGGLGPGGLEAAWFGTTFTFVIFYKLFNFFNILMEALLALARSYGQTRTEELSSWKLFNRGKTYLVPSILTVFKQLFN